MYNLTLIIYFKPTGLYIMRSGHGCKWIKVNLRNLIYIMLVEASQPAKSNN